MITLIQAVRLLQLPEYEIVYLCNRSQNSQAPSMSVAQMRKYLDMRRVRVYRINPYHFFCSPDIAYEFTISPRAEEYVKTVCRKKGIF